MKNTEENNTTTSHKNTNGVLIDEFFALNKKIFGRIKDILKNIGEMIVRFGNDEVPIAWIHVPSEDHCMSGTPIRAIALDADGNIAIYISKCQIDDVTDEELKGAMFEDKKWWMLNEPEISQDSIIGVYYLMESKYGSLKDRNKCYSVTMEWSRHCDDTEFIEPCTSGIEVKVFDSLYKAKEFLKTNAMREHRGEYTIVGGETDTTVKWKNGDFKHWKIHECDME